MFTSAMNLLLLFVSHGKSKKQIETRIRKISILIGNKFNYKREKRAYLSTGQNGSFIFLFSLS
jgi:hypothetical protein